MKSLNDIANSPQYCRLSHWTRTNVGLGQLDAIKILGLNCVGNETKPHQCHTIFLSLHSVPKLLHEDGWGASALALASHPSSWKSLATQWSLKHIVRHWCGFVSLPTQFHPKIFIASNCPNSTFVRVQCDSLQYCGEFAISLRDFTIIRK